MTGPGADVPGGQLPAAPLRVRRRRGGRQRHRITGALAVYGLVGIALLILTLVLTLVSLGTIEQLVRSVDDVGPARIGDRLSRVTSSLDEAQAAVSGFDATLDGTATAARSGQQLTSRLAESLRGLAASLDVTILGSRPFAGVGEQFTFVAGDADTLSRDLATTAGSLEENRAALRRLATELAGLRDEVESLRADLGARGAQGEEAPPPMTDAQAFTLSRLVLVALLAWLAIPPVVAIALAVRRFREYEEIEVESAPPAAPPPAEPPAAPPAEPPAAPPAAPPA